MNDLHTFTSPLIERLRRAGGVLELEGGKIMLPAEFGFCRGVTRALAMTEDACQQFGQKGTRLFLLGEIIHNPWVNRHFMDCGVRILSKSELKNIDNIISSEDCAIIPAFGVPIDIERQLKRIGCKIVNTSCGDVMRLWLWAEHAVERGFGILIFGRAMHDETVVTRSRLEDAGGKYLVVSNLQEARDFISLLTGKTPTENFQQTFTPRVTNSPTIEPFTKLAQVSQTTMLFNDTMELRDILRDGFERIYGQEAAQEKLILEPTVCRATQDRQSAAMQLCKADCDLVVVVGGFGSSNSRHLYEVARSYKPAVFIEDADAIESPTLLHSINIENDIPITVADWLPEKRPLTVGLLAGASSPEVVIGQVLEKLASCLSVKRNSGA